MKAKIKITKRVINDHSWLNDTWLAPYAGYVVYVYVFASGKINILIDGNMYENVHGFRTAPNGWRYKIQKLLSPCILPTQTV